jgi:hypothetical protein
MKPVLAKQSGGPGSRAADAASPAERELARVRAELAEALRTRDEWWAPELQRVTQALVDRDAALRPGASTEEHEALQQAHLAAAEELSQLRETRDGYWVPELARLTAEVEQAAANAERLARTKEEYWDPEIARLNAELARAQAELERSAAETDHLLRTKAEWWDPEIARLAAAWAEAQAETARLHGAVQHARRGLAEAEQRLAGEKQAHIATHGRLAELQALVDSWFRPERERLETLASEQRERLLAARAEAAVQAAAAHRAREEAGRQQSIAADALAEAGRQEAIAADTTAQAEAARAALHRIQTSRAYRLLVRPRALWMRVRGR